MWQSPIGRFEQAFDAKPFEDWCRESEVKYPKCSISASKDTGRCVVAAKDIKKDEVVVEVPDDKVLMPETSEIGQALEGNFDYTQHLSAYSVSGAAARVVLSMISTPGGLWLGTCEHSSLITSPTAPRAPAECGLVKPADDPIFEVLGLVLSVMYEKSKGSKSQ